MIGMVFAPGAVMAALAFVIPKRKTVQALADEPEALTFAEDFDRTERDGDSETRGHHDVDQGSVAPWSLMDASVEKTDMTTTKQDAAQPQGSIGGVETPRAPAGITSPFDAVDREIAKAAHVVSSGDVVSSGATMQVEGVASQEPLGDRGMIRVDDLLHGTVDQESRPWWEHPERYAEAGALAEPALDELGEQLADEERFLAIPESEPTTLIPPVVVPNIGEDDEVSYFGPRPASAEELAAARARWEAVIAENPIERAIGESEAAAATEHEVVRTSSTTVSEPLRPEWDGEEKIADVDDVTEQGLLEAYAREVDYREEIVGKLATIGTPASTVALLNSLEVGPPIEGWLALEGLVRLGKLDLDVAVRGNALVAARACFEVLGENASLEEIEHAVRARTTAEEAERILEYVRPAFL